MSGRGPSLTWHRLTAGDLAPLVTADMHQTWGVDLDHDPAARCWHWWRARVEQLLTIPPRIVPTPNGGAWVQQRTRLANTLTPPYATK